MGGDHDPAEQHGSDALHDGYRPVVIADEGDRLKKTPACDEFLWLQILGVGTLLAHLMLTVLLVATSVDSLQTDLFFGVSSSLSLSLSAWVGVVCCVLCFACVEMPTLETLVWAE